MKKTFVILLAALLLCSVSLAEAPVGLPHFATFREALEVAGKDAPVGEEIDYQSVVFAWNRKILRAVALPDSRARQLYVDFMGAEDVEAALGKYRSYARELPVTYVEEITVKPKEQAELDALAGKTVGEIEEAGYIISGSGGGLGMATYADLSYGLYNYEFELDATFEEYLEHQDRDDLKDLKVISGKYAGYSVFATDPEYLADGTYNPVVVPDRPEGEWTDIYPARPSDEYTRDAWPLTEEIYAELLGDPGAVAGRVCLVKGSVREALSENPLRVVIDAGEDGKPRPVVVECPEQIVFNWETGKEYRIYAEVTSAQDGLPVLTARYLYGW